MACSEWNVPCEPVKPWQITLVSLSTRTAMCGSSLVLGSVVFVRAGRYGGPDLVDRPDAHGAVFLRTRGVGRVVRGDRFVVLRHEFERFGQVEGGEPRIEAVEIAVAAQAPVAVDMIDGRHEILAVGGGEVLEERPAQPELEVKEAVPAHEEVGRRQRRRGDVEHLEADPVAGMGRGVGRDELGDDVRAEVLDAGDVGLGHPRPVAAGRVDEAGDAVAGEDTGQGGAQPRGFLERGASPRAGRPPVAGPGLAGEDGLEPAAHGGLRRVGLRPGAGRSCRVVTGKRHAFALGMIFRARACPRAAPPTISVPQAMACSEGNVPCEPVRPWRMTFLLLSTRTAIDLPVVLGSSHVFYSAIVVMIAPPIFLPRAFPSCA